MLCDLSRTDKFIGLVVSCCCRVCFRRWSASPDWHTAHNPSIVCCSTALGCWSWDQTPAKHHARVCHQHTWPRLQPGVLLSSIPCWRGVVRVISCIVTLCVCVHTLKAKWLELSIPNLVDIQSMVDAQHAFTLRWKVEDQGYQVHCRRRSQVDRSIWLLRFLAALLFIVSVDLLIYWVCFLLINLTAGAV